MAEVDVDVSLGGAIAVTVLDTTSGGKIAGGKCRLAGWSLRTTSTKSSVETQGQFNAPPAGTIIATMLLSPGQWTISWSVMVGGTVAAVEVNNFEIVQDGNLLVGSQNGITGDLPYPQVPVTVSVPAAGSTITIKAVLAATAASIYYAEMAAAPAGTVAVAEIISGSNPVAEIAIPLGDTDTHWFGSGGIELPADVTLNVISGSMRGAVYVALE